MQKIKNIIFDLGAVILNIDYELTINAFKKLGIENINEIYSKLKQNDLFDQFETGKIVAEEFRGQLIKHSKQLISAQQIDFAWNALLLDLPKERLELLAKLGKKYRLFLLSNTNEIHLKEFKGIIHREYGFADLSHLFEKEYYSHEIKYRKPHKEAFEYVLNENGLIPQETLFIDDSPQHIKGASKLGIHSLHLTSDITINQLFGENLQLKDMFIEQLYAERA